jgi:hypothetical protein
VDCCSSPWVALVMVAEAAAGAVDLEDSAEEALAVAVQAEIGKSAQDFQHYNTDNQLNPGPTPGAIQESLHQ